MDASKINLIIENCTVPLRKGAVLKNPADFSLVDVHFMDIGVDIFRASAARDSLVDLLNKFQGHQPLTDGPSYISLGADLGDQGYALRLLGLGKHLGLWNVITPASFGFDGEEANQLAGSGMVMCDGYRP